MANLGEFLTATFTNIGIGQDDQALKDVITKVATTDISDDLLKKFNTGYLSKDAAKSDPEIKKHYYALALNGVDSELDNLYAELNIDDAIKAELKAEKSTPKRVSLTVKKIKELEALAGKATGANKDALQKQIDDLNAAVLAEKQNAAKSILDEKKISDEKITNLIFNMQLKGLKYASPVSEDVNILTAKELLKRELTGKNIRVVNDNDNLKLVREDGTDYFEDNKKIDFETFRDRVMAQHKLIAVSEPQGSTTATPAATQTFTTQSPTNAHNKFLDKVSSLAEEAKLTA